MCTTFGTGPKFGTGTTFGTGGCTTFGTGSGGSEAGPVPHLVLVWSCPQGPDWVPVPHLVPVPLLVLVWACLPVPDLVLVCARLPVPDLVPVCACLPVPHLVLVGSAFWPLPHSKLRANWSLVPGLLMTDSKPICSSAEVARITDLRSRHVLSAIKATEGSQRLLSALWWSARHTNTNF